MKKIVTVGMLAMSVLVLSGSQALAWVNSRFSVGLNWEWQSGGNSFLWGAYSSGQPPAYAGSCAPVYYGYPSYGTVYESSTPALTYAPNSANVAPQTAPAYNYNATYQFANYPQYPYYYPTNGYGR